MSVRKRLFVIRATADIPQASRAATLSSPQPRIGIRLTGAPGPWGPDQPCQQPRGLFAFLALDSYTSAVQITSRRVVATQPAAAAAIV